MLIIEESICELKELAEQERTIGKSLLDKLDDKRGCDWYDKRAEEHEQLAEWLDELVVLRKAYEMACKECYGMTWEYCSEHGDDDCEKCDRFEECGNPENLKTYYLNKAKENINGRD